MKVVDLFSGGGGLTLGFSQAGFNVVGAIENWRPALTVYRENFSDHPVLEIDLSDVEKSVDAISIFSPDIIIGGPPCQDFSSAGKRDEGQGRAHLTICFSRIIAECRPDYFLMENVERANRSDAFKTAIQQFKDSGYALTIRIIDASLCGVPQKRKRLIVIGSLKDEDDFLGDLLDSGLSKSAMTLREYFKDGLNFEHYYRHPRSYARRGIFSVDEPSPTIRGVNRPVPKGYLGHPGDSCGMSPELRCLTTQERALIQTFPKNYRLTGTKTDIEQVIGNAVPVKLAEYVAKQLHQHIVGKGSTSAPPFPN